MKIRVRKIGIIACLSFIISFFALHIAQAQTGTWRTYLSYYEPQQIVKGDNRLYVRASNNLYSYNLNDKSITTYDNIQPLSDSNIKMIAWNPTVKKIIIIYQNYNIDLLDQYDEVFNISSYYNKNTTLDKTVNNIFIHSQFAYIATAFGVIKIDMKREEIAESYILKHNVQKTAIVNDSIFVQDNNSTVLKASLLANLIDPNNWAVTTTYDASIFNQSTADWDNYIETVKTLKPGGPKYNHFGFMRFKNNVLYTSDAGLKQAKQLDMQYPATIQTLDANKEWTFYQDDIKGNFPGTESSSWYFVDMQSVDVDPLNPSHVFGGSRTGLYEFMDGKCLKYYYPDNSILDRASSSNKYVKVESVLFDKDGNLFLTQSGTKNALLMITKDGEWKNLTHDEWMNNGKSIGSLQSLFLDSRGLLWFVNNMYDVPGFFCYDPTNDKVIQTFTSFNNQDGITYGNETYYPRTLAEDREGNIWMGSSIGVFLVEAENVYTTGTHLLQIKVPRNDGTDLADYLLANANVSCIVIDEANRKWVGTENNGVYLISADNMTELHHFTKENSSLLSNAIESIAISPITGEVFIGTNNGLCSYTSDVTAPVSDMKKDEVYSFPNPVPSGYNGLITIRGLSYDADVKILTIDGRLVNEGRSNGGTYTWNGCDRSGRRVASGVYMIATATSDGKAGVVAKIAIVH